MPEFTKKRLYHTPPNWVPSGERYFITLCSKPRGFNQLANKTNFDSITKTFKMYESQNKLYCYICLFMPDHIHTILSLNTNQFKISQIIGSLKSYSAKNLAVEWQRDFFDHRLRNSKEFAEKLEYIRNNPVRAGLVDNAEAWPFVVEKR
ncbi:MAG: REP-associated tyrosine transposase [Opitutales bacterium]